MPLFFAVQNTVKEKRRKKYAKIYEKRRKSIICWYANSQNHVK